MCIYGELFSICRVVVSRGSKKNFPLMKGVELSGSVLSETGTASSQVPGF
jgi:hypothetical protein